MTVSSRVRNIMFAIIMMVLAYLYFSYDPALYKWAPKCVFHLLTGWECPGCGSQRMIHAMLHGDFANAWRSNPFLMCMLPLLALMGYAAMYRESKPRLYAVLNSVPVILICSVALLMWGVLRNVFPLS